MGRAKNSGLGRDRAVVETALRAASQILTAAEDLLFLDKLQRAAEKDEEASERCVELGEQIERADTELFVALRSVGSYIDAAVMETDGSMSTIFGGQAFRSAFAVAGEIASVFDVPVMRWWLERFGYVQPAIYLKQFAGLFPGVAIEDFWQLQQQLTQQGNTVLWRLRESSEVPWHERAILRLAQTDDSVTQIAADLEVPRTALYKHPEVKKAIAMRKGRAADHLRRGSKNAGKVEAFDE